MIFDYILILADLIKAFDTVSIPVRLSELQNLDVRVLQLQGFSVIYQIDHNTQK